MNPVEHERPPGDGPPRDGQGWGRPPSPGRTGRTRAARAGARAFRIVLGTVVVAAALKLGQPVLVPLVSGLFLAVLARPLQLAIRRVMPGPLRWLGLVGAMLAVVGVVAAFGGALVFSGRAVAAELRERRPRLEATLAEVRGRAERLGVPPTAIPSLPGGGSTAGGASGGSASGGSASGGGASGRGEAGGAAGGGSGGSPTALAPVRSVATGLVRGLGELLLALAFCALGLAEAGTARRRLARAVPRGFDPSVLRTVDEATQAFRRYAWVKTLTSALTGLATWLAALAFGCRWRGCGGFSPSCSSTCRASGRCSRWSRRRSWRWRSTGPDARSWSSSGSARCR
jgi:hypothetical protein